MHLKLALRHFLLFWINLLLIWNFAVHAQSGVWIAQGPAPITEGQVENITNREVVGAVHAIAPHPSDPNVLYIGSVNGGIWRTGNALATSPTWVPQTDQQNSLSVGAIEFDPTDANNQTLVAGIGIFSNIGNVGTSLSGGALTGLLRTTDGGATWMPIGTGPLAGANISGVAARGNVIVAADTNGGIWRSTDTGAMWTQISGLAGSGLPAGGAFDLAAVPGTPARLYTNARDGIYVSTNTGADWNQVSSAAMNALAPYGNVRISAIGGSVVFVAVSRGGALTGVFRSPDGGGTWTAMDIPGTTEVNGTFYGIHPGGQAGVNLSMVADPTDATGNTVYVGGDRQPGPAGLPNENFPFPNLIGAQRFTGRLFRGNAAAAAGTQFVHLTHSNSQGPAGGGTATGSSPHADSRNLAVDAAGNLIESDDGGVYRRTMPQSNAGDWLSMNGNLQNTEFHSIAWDAVADRIIGGAQDVGTPEQQDFSGSVWPAAITADGGVVAVDDVSTPGQSTRYFSTQCLSAQCFVAGGTLSTRQFDSDNTPQAVLPAPLNVVGGAALQPQFYTPVVVNNMGGNRLIVGGFNSVYESLNGGQTVTEIGVGIQANSALQGEAIAYGAADNIEMLYVGSGTNVFVRNGAHPGTLLTASATYPGTRTVVDVAIDPQDSQTAAVVDRAAVFLTRDGGGTWTAITGDLSALGVGQFRSAAIFRVAEQEAVVVGTDRGVLWNDTLTATNWSETCSGLPNAPAVDLEFDTADELLLVGTLGRGAWFCAPTRAGATEYRVKFVCGEGDDRILGQGNYATAINIINSDNDDAQPAAYRRSFSVALISENVGGQTPGRRGAMLAPGEAVEIDCEDILAEAERLCTEPLCKGFASFESSVPLEIVVVYSAASLDTGQVEGIHTERVSGPNEHCTETMTRVPAQNILFVPPHVQGDREFDGNGPCIQFSLDLGIEDDGSALLAKFWMQAYECADFNKPQADFTAAEGTGSRILATAGPGGRILGYSTLGRATHSYRDTDHAADDVPGQASDPVTNLQFVGDTSGDESGTKTSVRIALRDIDVRMQSCAIPGGSGN